jgi:hypothetical protein
MVARDILTDSTFDPQLGAWNKITAMLRKIFFTMTKVLIVSFFTQRVNAHLYPGPISSALGESSIVNIDPVEGPLYNPAILPHLKREFQSGVVFGQGSTIELRDDRYWGVVLSDCSKDTYFPASAGYVASRTTFGNQDAADEKYFTLGGGNFVWKQLSLGISLNRRESQFPTTEKLVQNNFTVGAIWPLGPTLAVGAIAQNLANPGGEIPAYLELPARVGVGGYYIYKNRFHTRLDVSQKTRNNPHNHLTYSVGIDSQFQQFLAARLGYLLDPQAERHVLTAGFGFMGPRLSLSYGYQVENQNGSGSRHVIDLQMPF